MMNTGVKVGDAMTKNPIYVLPDTPIQDIAEEMHKKEVGSVLVSKGGELLGIISERDMVKKALTSSLDKLSKLKAENIMTSKVITINSEEDLYDAILLMRDENKRRLPVTQGKKIIGMLTYQDILKIQPDLYTLFIERFQIKESERKSKYLGKGT